MNKCTTASPLHLFHHLVQLKKHGNGVISGLDCIFGMADQAARSFFRASGLERQESAQDRASLVKIRGAAGVT